MREGCQTVGMFILLFCFSGSPRIVCLVPWYGPVSQESSGGGVGWGGGVAVAVG